MAITNELLDPEYATRLLTKKLACEGLKQYHMYILD